MKPTNGPRYIFLSTDGSVVLESDFLVLALAKRLGAGFMQTKLGARYELLPEGMRRLRRIL